jgi:hypothetical protein
MRRAARTAFLLVLAGAVAAAAPDKVQLPRVVFLGPPDGVLAPMADEFFVGIKAAIGNETELTRDWPKKLHAWEPVFADLAKRDVTIAIAAVPDGEVATLDHAAEKAKVPLLVLSHESTKPELDPAHAIFWAGGLRPCDEALEAMSFALVPLSMHAPAIFHDRSARGVEAASKCSRLSHFAQKPREPVELPADFGVSDVVGTLGRHVSSVVKEGATFSTEGADGIIYFGGPEGAERLLAACAKAKSDAPVLLGQGAATRSVPSFANGEVANAWCLEPAYFEDYVDAKGSPAPPDAPTLALAAKETGDHLYAATILGWRAARWIHDAIRLMPSTGEKKPEKRFLAALRGLAREGARGKQIFENWGHASLARAESWRCAKVRNDPPCTRQRPTYMPMVGIPQIGTYASSRFVWEPGSTYVWVHWGTPEERTIEKDLTKLGLNAPDLDPKLREKLVDDLLGRTMSRLNRLFLRNPDGTAIPGLSFNVTFGAEKEPAGLKPGHRFEMVMRGDSQIAGGVAHGTSCEVFTTYIERTMYVKDAIKPPISAADKPYVFGEYKWGTALDSNLRSDRVRALGDGFTQGFSLTGAHEAGHMFGLGHDELTPRSIMNVVEAVGLDFEWGEWIPDHLKVLEARLGRVPFGQSTPK